MTKRKTETKRFHRLATFTREAIDTEARTVELAFSSETDQVERWFGIEILDHGPESIRLGRLKNGAPVLVGHNQDDQVGVVETVELGPDRVARAVVRFGKSARASEIFEDLADGIRTKVSVGYAIHKREETDEGTEHKPVYRVTDWEPYEISIVSIPADDSVGVGREAETLNPDSEKSTMSNEETQRAAASNAASPAPAAQSVDVDQIKKDARKAEQSRIREISAIAKRRGLEADGEKFIDDGKTVDQFRAYVVDKMDDDPAPAPARHADVDLNERENKEYSVVRAISAASSGDWSQAGFEREISEEIGQKLKRSTTGIYIPTSLRHTPDMLRRMGEVREQRALVAGTGSAGGFSVETGVMSLIDLLRNKMVVRQLGARVLSGLQGDLSFPRMASGSAFSWVAENPGSDLADSDAVFEQVAMTPKTGQSTTAYSRQMLAQSSLDIEMLVRDDLTQAAALGIDLAAINGTGASNQPEGILNVTGIGSVAGGTNGLAPTWDHIVDLEGAVSVDNADIGALAYLTNTKVKTKLKKTMVEAGTAERVWGKGDEVNGYTAGVSNQVPSNLTKGTSTGVCSAIIFGNFNDLMIGEWGAMEIITDPYSKKKQGLVEVTSFCMADIAVRHPESFAAMVDALTA